MKNQPTLETSQDSCQVYLHANNGESHLQFTCTEMDDARIYCIKRPALPLMVEWWSADLGNGERELFTREFYGTHKGVNHTNPQQ
jgi:hypothetical protein